MKEQSDFLKELFNRVSKRIGRPYSAFAPMEQELRKNWYDTPEAIMGVTDQQYEKMNVPLRVSTQIRKELGCSTVQNQQPTTETNNQNPSPPLEKKNSKKPQSNKEVLNEVSIPLLVVDLQNQMMEKYPWIGQELLKVFQTLQKIIKNIAEDSYELKFRVLKKSNAKIQDILLSNPPVMKFLKKIGFEQDEEKVFLDTFDTHAFFCVQQCLAAVVENHRTQNQQQNQHINNLYKKQQTKPMFLPPDLKLPAKGEDPNHGKSVTLAKQFPKKDLQECNYAQMLDKLLQYRKQIMSTAPSNRHIRIYHKRHDKKDVPHIVMDMDHELGHGQDDMMNRYWISVMKQNQKNAKFQSKRKTEFQFLLSQQVYRETTIRLRLPNQLIIQARFGPLETLGNVFAVVASIVIGQFYLYQSPPVKRLDKEMHRTLDSLDSVPCGYFYIGLNSEWYIQNEYAKQIMM